MPEPMTGMIAVDAASQAVRAAIQGATALLSRICLPAAQEYGLLLKDRVSEMRAMNFIAMMRRVEQKLLENHVPDSAHADLRLAHRIREESSWIGDSVVQDMWAGLLSSSCTEDGDDDSNLVFTNYLARLTKLQARLLKYACENASKFVTRTGGLVQVHPLLLTFDELVAVAGESNLHRLDRELDDLRSAGLLDPRRAGFNGFNAATADLTPTPLAAHMYVRCCGSRASAVDYFNLTPYPPDPPATSPTLASGQAPDAPTGEITVPAP